MSDKTKNDVSYRERCLRHKKLNMEEIRFPRGLVNHKVDIAKGKGHGLYKKREPNIKAKKDEER